MSDWLDVFAQALDGRLEQTEASAGLAPEQRNLLLGLARDVAHGTERKNAPLATYIAGRYAAAKGTPDALDEAVEVARSLLPVIEAD